MEHPFYVEGQGWTGAGELKSGDSLIHIIGEEVTVESVTVEKCAEPAKVYNFEVKDFHTYYVGHESVLVHNKCVQKMGKNRGNTPGNNRKQNKEVDEVVRRLKLTKDERRTLHDYISHEGYGFKEILEIAKDLFGK